MPATVLSQKPRTLLRHNVVGERTAGQTPSFVTHVGLLDADSLSVKANDDVSAVHMRPPLEQGGTIEAHVEGHVPLTNDEIKEISAWIGEVADEYHTSGVNTIRQYVIDPPWKDEIDLNTGVRRYRRYSCAGFVLDAHCKIDIELLKIDTEALPEVDQQKIASAYPEVSISPRRLARYGLKGNGPYRIVLAGYVLHALNRPTDQIRREPYQVQTGDEQF